MANKYHDSQIAARSLNQQFRFYKIELQKTDKDIYPIELLNGAMCTLRYVIRTTDLKTCLKTPEFKQLFMQLKKKIIPKPSLSFLKSTGCTDDDLYTIDTYTRLFDEIHSQLQLSGEYLSSDQ